MHGAENHLCHGARPGRALGTLHRVSRGATGASSGLVPSRGGEQYRRLAELFTAPAKLRVIPLQVTSEAGPTLSPPAVRSLLGQSSRLPPPHAHATRDRFIPNKACSQSRRGPASPSPGRP